MTPINPPCDPFIQRFDVPLTGSDGPLAGLTAGIKDNFDVAGHVTGNGNPEWARDQTPAQADAPVVARLRTLGVVVVGKTQMDELAFSLMGVNARHGTPPNPAAPERVPGGSSSGSAAAVAAGLCDIGVGSDTGGSVRLPAAFCGVFGWRPSHGLFSDVGMAPLAPSFDVPGFLTRDAATLQRLAQALLPPRSHTAPTRILAPYDLWSMAEPATRRVLESVLARLADRFGEADRTALADGDLSNWRQAFRVHQGHEVWLTLGRWVKKAAPAFGSDVKARFDWAATVDTDAFRHAVAVREKAATRLADALGQDAILVWPTGPGPAPLRTTPADALEDYRSAALALLCPAGLAGAPQVSIPVGLVQGAPIGLSLIGARGDDLRVVETATTCAALAS